VIRSQQQTFQQQTRSSSLPTSLYKSEHNLHDHQQHQEGDVANQRVPVAPILAEPNNSRSLAGEGGTNAANARTSDASMYQSIVFGILDASSEGMYRCVRGHKVLLTSNYLLELID
jgi:hypothetical protein